MAARFQALTFIAEFWEQNPQFWFGATPDDDRRISELLEPFIDDFAEFSLATLPTTDLQQKVGWVILYDQILKHVNRYRAQDVSVGNKCFVPYLAPDDLAEQCWQEFQEYYEPDIALTDFEFGFLLMPMRHTHQLSQVRLVLSAAWSRLQNKPPGTDTTFMRNYIKATYTRLAKFISIDDPETWIDYPLFEREQLHRFLMINMNKLMDLWDADKGYLDPQCYGAVPHEIQVVTRLVPPSQEQIMANKLLTCMSSFVAANGITRLPPTGTKQEPSLVVSLSGGVDSMVCAYLLWALGVPFRALHVNYYNRDPDVCVMEEFLVRYYCALLGIHLRVVRTDEINRPKCMEHGLREIYESYTHDRRFNGYLSFANQDNEYDMLDGTGRVAVRVALHPSVAVRVALGHNQDDTIENILTNIACQSHYDNLRGMTPISKQTHRGRQIQFLRPLLGIAKRDIYAFANAHRIPYLVDSTPKWSQRGKIRDIVRPALESWNPEILSALQILSDRLTDMTRTLDEVIPSAGTNTSTGETIIFAGFTQVPRTQNYWSRVFKGITITQKTLREWISKLNFLDEHPEKLIVNQPIRFTLAKEMSLTITLRKDKTIKIGIVRATSTKTQFPTC
jgi:tRNA(Ile)-lysidine synthase TilS/MesJ